MLSAAAHDPPPDRERGTVAELVGSEFDVVPAVVETDVVQWQVAELVRDEGSATAHVEDRAVRRNVPAGHVRDEVVTHLVPMGVVLTPNVEFLLECRHTLVVVTAEGLEVGGAQQLTLAGSAFLAALPVADVGSGPHPQQRGAGGHP